MKLADYFQSFLETQVNLNQSRVDLLDDRVRAITDFLHDSALLKERFIDVVPQGSYAHRTIIKPARGSGEFDADILLHLEEFPGWSAEDYVQNLYSLFGESGTYRQMVSRRTRCVVVDYAGDFHVDVVPYLERHGAFYITNRHDNVFELTNPEGYNVWLEEKNRVAGGHLVKVIRLLKYLRDSKQTFSVKSIVLNTLVGQVVNDARALSEPGCYSDVPTTLRTVIRDLAGYLKRSPSLPRIEDPSCPGEEFSSRWSQEPYSNFRYWAGFYADRIADAYDESVRDESVRKWQAVFGTDFVAPKRETSESASPIRKAGLDDPEQFLEHLGVPVAITPSYHLRIGGSVLPRDGFRSFSLRSQGNVVGKSRKIRFVIEKCDVPRPYQVKWKVKNRGLEAEGANCLRGQIVDDDGTESRVEPTAYRGSHYVECYIIRNGMCVAKDHQPVIIK